MSDSTTSMTDLLGKIQECLVDKDVEAASFLREGIFEQVRLHDCWLSSTEWDFLSSF